MYTIHTSIAPSGSISSLPLFCIRVTSISASKRKQAVSPIFSNPIRLLTQFGESAAESLLVRTVGDLSMFISQYCTVQFDKQIDKDAVLKVVWLTAHEVSNFVVKT